MAKYARSNELFINPYNFVPINLKKTERSDITKNQENTITGYLDCQLRCKTPLAIPDTSRKVKNDNEHQKYPFFSVGGEKPVIPGSSIRGVIRSAYETITDSCLGSMKKDTLFTVRNHDAAFRPGLIIKEVIHGKEKWRLYEAKRHLVVIDQQFYDRHGLKNKGVKLYNLNKSGYHSGDEVKFNLVQWAGRDYGYAKQGYPIGVYSNIESNGRDVGYICIGERSPRRHFQSIFEKVRATREVTKKDFSRLEEILHEYRDDKINRLYGRAHKGYRDYEYAKEKGVIPVYYTLQGSKLYVSFAAIGRKAFWKTLNDKAGEKSHQKCDSRKNLCPACALFGTTEGDMAGSRVRFSDAECSNFEQKLLKKSITFQELASPHASYYPFYLRSKGRVADYSAGYDSSSLNIKGRKYYWHHEPDLRTEVKQDKRNATFDVMDTGSEFIFRIYFENITEKQLTWLVASINLSENKIDGHYCHKLGHGKPLGFGSAKMVVDQCVIREYTADENGLMIWKTSLRDIPDTKECYSCEKETYDAFIKICDFDALSGFEGSVSYPTVKLDPEYEDRRNELGSNVLAGHQWFSNNYRFGAMPPKRYLPDILDDEPGLPIYMYTDLNEPVQRNPRGGQNRRNPGGNHAGRRNWRRN